MMRRPDIDKLLRLLPPKSGRQTVLFSATFPANTQELCDFALRPNPVVVDTVGEDTEQTARRVRLSYPALILSDPVSSGLIYLPPVEHCPCKGHDACAHWVQLPVSLYVQGLTVRQIAVCQLVANSVGKIGSSIDS